MAVAYFHDEAHIQMPLTRFTSPEDVYYALETMNPPGGKTNTAKGLKLARNEIFNTRGKSLSFSS